MTLASTTSQLKPRPILKWAGGKTQLLSELRSRLPVNYGKYIEPFFGGGALFFDLEPSRSVISDINPELINLYKTVSCNVEELIAELHQHKNDEEHFYQIRALDWTKLSPVEAAARTMYLNRTCYNGLYRVNKSGAFNVPFGRYKNPRIIDETNLRNTAIALSKTQIVLGTYKQTLATHAEPGDLVFLDPPYLPISEYSDFKRYNREQFHETDHRELATEVHRLHDIGCYVLLTNSNHPLVHDLYKDFQIDVIQTRRHINSRANSRKGEDAVVTVSPNGK